METLEIEIFILNFLKNNTNLEISSLVTFNFLFFLFSKFQIVILNTKTFSALPNNQTNKSIW